MGLGIGDIGKPYGIKTRRKRVGRGIGSGHGKTAGRGHKGAKSRSGGGDYAMGFEGGQMPLIRRVPKRGFTSKFKRKWNIVNLGSLERVEKIASGTVIDKDFLIQNNIIKKRALPIKILGKGKLEKVLTLRANAFSLSAKKAIEAVGGKAEVV